MNWIEGISEAINYIEANLENDLKIEEIAQKAFASSFCFKFLYIELYTKICNLSTKMIRHKAA